MKKYFLLFLPLVLIQTVFLADAKASGPQRIVSVQHQEFEPYTQSYNGFVEGLKKLGYTDKVVLERFNAKSDMQSLDQKIKSLADDKSVDLILSIGTQSTKRLIGTVKDTPIVFTDLGDPEHSGVLSNWKSSGANYTGVETPGYISLGIRMIHELMPFKRLGMIYLSGSPEHDGAILQVKQLCDNLGIAFVYEGFPLRDANQVNFPKEVTQKRIVDALEKVVPQVDVFYVQISKTFEDNFHYFREAFVKHQVPSVGDPVYIKRGIIMGIGRDKQNFGEQCAEYAIKILNGTRPADLPMDVGKKFSITFNLQAAVMVGFDPPVDVLGAADKIYQEIEE